MKTITYETIKSAIKVGDLFEAIEQAFIDYNSPKLIGIPVSLLHFANNGDAHIKTAAIQGYDYFSIKVATMFPQNAEQNIPPYNGSIFLFDAKTGELKTILQDRGLLTDLRTAAAGAIITNFAADKNATSVAVIGTGIQAFHQVDALAQLRKITEVAIYGRNENHALLLKNKLKKVHQNISIKIVKTTEEAAKTSSIIITTTPSKLPLIKGEWLSKGQHLTAIGADDTFKNEIDFDCFKNADTIFIDSLELNKKYGEYSHAILLKPDLIHKTIEFGKAFSNKQYANNQDKITVAKLVGVGIQDLAASTVLMKKL